MSTRRSTRATSRNASSRGASPAISTADIPATPRRISRRGGNANAPLPAVGLRTSTAYGTNTVPEPARAAGPQVSEQLNSVLGGILNPVPENDASGDAETPAPKRRGRQSRDITPAPSSANRSFHHESGIFNQAAIDDSVVQESPELHDIPEEREPVGSGPFPESLDTRLEREDAARRQELEILARQRLVEVRAASGQTTLEDLWITKELTWAWVLSAIKFFIAVSKEFWFFIAFALLVTATVKAFWSSDIRFYGLDVRHNIGQFIPYSIAHPFDNFNPAEIKDIHRRLNDLEYQIAKAKTHFDFDQKSVTKLEKMLPEYLVVKKDRYGNRIIPDDFWHALQDKIRSDQTLFSDQPEATGKKTPPGTSLSIRDVERIAGKEWDKFIKSNHAKMGAVLGDELAKKFPQLIEEHHIASKVDILEMIRQNWDENRKEVKSEMNQLTKKLENASRQIQSIHQDHSGLTKKEVRAIAEEVVRKLLPHAQLEALARSNLQQNVNYGLTRVNHFSKGTGAAVVPGLTSPNYVFPSQDIWFPKRWIRAVMGNAIPAPKAPETALTRWEEHGDCWCSPNKDSDGYGPSLGVLMASTIYPDQVVVEHILPSAALEPGAAPREMELLAEINGSETYNSLKAMSDDIFGIESDPEQAAYRFVRIASFTYDIESNQNVQAFPVQLDMKALGASTNRIIVRPKSNWGGPNVDYTCIYRVRLHGEIV